jgi:phosphatidylserine/phosphatidylglycerophosphate/cardiolipin synthase-like enzyme
MGERSIARAYQKAFALARSLIYIEDQYLWSEVVGEYLADALRRNEELRVLIVVPPYPDRDGRVSGPPSRIGQIEALERLRRAGEDRVGVYHLVSDEGRPIYVHAKVCVVDDVWAIVGSDNMTIRSWTHDSELSCAVVDETRDHREPTDPSGTGEGARVFARDLRLRLWREHLGPKIDEAELIDPVQGARTWQDAADRTDSRVRRHRPEPVRSWQLVWARPAYRFVVDPDGRRRGRRRGF